MFAAELFACPACFPWTIGSGFTPTLAWKLKPLATVYLQIVPRLSSLRRLSDRLASRAKRLPEDSSDLPVLPGNSA